MEEIAARKIPDVSALVKELNGFEPRIMLRLFLDGIYGCVRSLMLSPSGFKALEEINASILDCYNHVTVYNQSVQASLELLVRELSRINKISGNILKCATM